MYSNREPDCPTDCHPGLVINGGDSVEVCYAGGSAHLLVCLTSPLRALNCTVNSLPTLNFWVSQIFDERMISKALLLIPLFPGEHFSLQESVPVGILPPLYHITDTSRLSLLKLIFQHLKK